MSTAQITKGLPEQPPVRARFVGIYYMVTIVTGILVLSFHGKLAFAFDFLAGILFLILTAFFYGVSRPPAAKRER